MINQIFLVPNICSEVKCPVGVDENNNYSFYHSFQFDSNFDANLKPKQMFHIQNLNESDTQNENVINNINDNSSFDSGFNCFQISPAQNFFECLCKPGFKGLDCSQCKTSFISFFNLLFYTFLYSN